MWVSLPTFADWRQRLPDARLAGYSVLDFSVFGDEGPEPILAGRVTDDLLDMLGVRMALGRAFDGDEYLADGPRSVILSHAFWQRRYGADPAVVGRSIELPGPAFLPGDSGGYRVVGVLPPEFWLFSNRLETAVVLFILVVVNVAGTILALTVARRKEYAVRAALGTSRRALLRQALAERLLLCAAGGVMGLCLGSAGASALQTACPARSCPAFRERPKP